MLHILWMLIKWILILLGIFLGVVLLLLFLILFCPVRYEGRAVKEGVPFRETEAAIKVSWLFRGVSFSMRYKDGAGHQELKVFGVPVLAILKKYRNKKTASPKRAEKREIRIQESEEQDKSEQPFEKPEEALHSAPFMKDEEKRFEGTAEKQNFEKKQNKIVKIWETLKDIWERCKSIPNIFHRISLTIKGICDKIDWWKAFFQHPRTKAGITYAREKVCRLLRHVFPGKISGHIDFGSEDPSVTGTVLAVLGMTIPLHQNRIEIVPVFENRNLLEGNVTVKGRVYCIVPIVILLKLYFNQDIKYIIRRWKHKEV